MLDQVMPDPKRRRGLMLVMSSPSGAGKTSLSRRVLELEPELALSISVTTRPQRPGETDGVHYHFIDQPRFAAMAAGGELLEHARVYGHSYGTPRAAVETRRWLRPGRPVRHRLAGCPAAPRRRVRRHGGRVHPAALTCPSSSAACAAAPRTPRDRPLPPGPGRLGRHPLARVRLCPGQQGVRGQRCGALRAILAAERLRRQRHPALTDFVQQFRAATDQQP